jgi:endonuclease YncB( thermonuclease family)
MKIFSHLKRSFFLAPAILFVFVPAILVAGQYQVIRVIDGDTIKIDDGKQKETIRLVGIDAL